METNKQAVLWLGSLGKSADGSPPIVCGGVQRVFLQTPISGFAHNFEFSLAVVFREPEKLSVTPRCFYS